LTSRRASKRFPFTEKLFERSLISRRAAIVAGVWSAEV
jgi:hypothetical protein